MSGIDFSAYEAPKVFNNGESGEVKNVTLRIDSVEPVAGKNMPAFNIIVIDNEGRELRGPSIWEPNGSETAEQVKKMVQNLGNTWRDCMGTTPFLTKPTMRQFWDAIAESGNTFRVFVTYGTTEKPSRWLGTRRYDWVASMTSNKKFAVKTTDLMVRPAADSEATTEDQVSDLPFVNQ